jgi:hypothetical protein
MADKDKDKLENELKQFLQKNIGNINKVISTINNPIIPPSGSVALDEQVRKWVKENMSTIQKSLGLQSNGATPDSILSKMNSLISSLPPGMPASFKDQMKSLSKEFAMYNNQLKDAGNYTNELFSKSKSNVDPVKCKQQQQIAKKAAINKSLRNMSNTLSQISGWFAPKEKRKIMTIQTFIYKSLIHPTSKDIENILVNIYTSGLTLGDKVRSVDDMLLRLRQAAHPDSISLDKDSDTYLRTESIQRVIPPPIVPK